MTSCQLLKLATGVKFHEYFTLVLNKIKIFALSSAEVITKCACLCAAAQGGGFILSEGMQKGYLLQFKNICGILCIRRQK